MSRLITIFKIPELRMKIFFTLGLLAIYRLGFFVPLPFIDQQSMADWAKSQGSDVRNVMSMVGMFSGTNISAGTIFGLGIMPYISASIIFQLLASTIPALEKLKKEGEVGQKKINEYTRYATVVICLIQSVFWVRYLMSQKLAGGDLSVVSSEYQGFFYVMVSVMVMTAGTLFLMWIGEQIDEYGIGNGISLIIMAGIVGRVPVAFDSLLKGIQQAGGLSFSPQQGIGIESLIVLSSLFVGVVAIVITITQGQRRIPIQSAKHVRARRIVGGNRHSLPLRVNQAGVMPIIFASSLLIFPTIVLGWIVGVLAAPTWLQLLYDSFRYQGFFYTLCDITLIYFFCYFWTAITFNPKDMANNLKDMGSFIPGYRPGRRTAEYLERVMLRITYVGAAFLAFVSIIPMLVARFLNVDYQVASFFGGTGLLILISVALDLVQKIDNHLITRNYDSLLTSSQSTG